MNSRRKNKKRKLEDKAYNPKKDRAKKRVCNQHREHSDSQNHQKNKIGLRCDLSKQVTDTSSGNEGPIKTTTMINEEAFILKNTQIAEHLKQRYSSGLISIPSHRPIGGIVERSPEGSPTKIATPDRNSVLLEKQK